METKLKADFKKMYSEVNLPDAADIVVLTLGDLERAGYSMNNYVSYDKKSSCNKAMTYAERSVVKGKEQIKVYYLCDEDANYDYIG